MASAGQATAQSPQAVQRSAPFSSRFSTCWPRQTALNSLFFSGYLTVAFLLKRCLMVIITPPRMAGRYILSAKVISFFTTTFDLPDKDCIAISPLLISPLKSSPNPLGQHLQLPAGSIFSSRDSLTDHNGNAAVSSGST